MYFASVKVTDVFYKKDGSKYIATYNGSEMHITTNRNNSSPKSLFIGDLVICDRVAVKSMDLYRIVFSGFRSEVDPLTKKTIHHRVEVLATR